MSEVKAKDGHLTDVQVKLRAQLRMLGEKINNDVYEQRKHLFGRVSTIVEATLADSEQRKAVKDLLSQAVYGDSYWNGISYQLNQLAEANGFNLYEDTVGLNQPIQSAELAEPANEYEKV